MDTIKGVSTTQPQCTAPVRGHFLTNHALKCPVHGPAMRQAAGLPMPSLVGTAPTSSQSIKHVDEIVTAQRDCESSSTPIERLIEHAESQNSKVREYVARSKYAPPGLLAGLFDDESPGVREGVCSNPNTPKDVLELALVDPERNVQATAIGKWRGTAEQTHQLVLDNTGDQYILGQFVDHPSASRATVEYLVSKRPTWCGARTAGRTDLGADWPRWVYDNTVDSPARQSVQEALLVNPTTPDDLLLEILAHLDKCPDSRRTPTDISPQIMLTMVAMPDSEHLYAHKDFTPEASEVAYDRCAGYLRDIARDVDVRSPVVALAGSSQASPEVLARIVDDALENGALKTGRRHHRVATRAVVEAAANSATPAESLEAIWTNARGHEGVSVALAGNSSTPLHIVGALEKEYQPDDQWDLGVPIGLMRNPNASPGFMRKMDAIMADSYAPLTSENHKVTIDRIQWSERVDKWIAHRVGVSPDNRDALEYLRTQDWWSLTPESKEVALTRVVSPDP